MNSPVVLLVFDAALAVVALLLEEQGRVVPALSTFGALAVLGTWQLVLFTMTPQPTIKYKIVPFYARPHYVTSLIQVLVYAYLALYWDAIRNNAILLLAQIIVGALCDILLAWNRGRTARLSFGIVPVILSMNLFLWFREDYYYLQFLMVALAFFSKDFVTWNYEGRRRHIFNPSALPLTVLAVLIMLTGRLDLTSGVDLVALFEFVPSFYEVIFLLGLVPQVLFRTAPVSLGSVLSLCSLYYVTQWIIGEPLSEMAIHPQVLLGLTFLVTDPATSPKSNLGRFLAGLMYGARVFVFSIILQFSHQPGFFDKLLMVPLVNLTVPLFDRLSARLERFGAPVFDFVTAPVSRFGWFAAYFALMSLILPDLKIASKRPITLVPKSTFELSQDMQVIARNYSFCKKYYPRAYQPYGLSYEMAHLKTLRHIYHLGPADQPPPVAPPADN